MSFDQSGYNNNKQEEYRATFYSPLRCSNPESEVDPTQLSFRYWKNLLGILISPKIENSNSEYTQYDNENNIQVYINPTKARMLWNEMQLLKESPDQYQSVGIHTNSNGLVSVCNGKEVGVSGPVLILRKLDQNGQIISSFMYQFNQNYHYSIRNFDETTLKYDKNYFDWIEFDEFSDVLRTYFENAGQMLAFGVVDSSRKEFNRLHKKLNTMMSKLGVDFNDGYKGHGSGKSFFDMSNQGSQFADNAAAGIPDRSISASTIDALSEEMG